MMERSLALKSPSIHYHLAGTKKVSATKDVENFDQWSLFLSGPTGVGQTRPAWEIPWRQAKGKIVYKAEYHLWFSSLADRIGERCVHRTLQPGQVIKLWWSALFTLLWVAVFCFQSNTSFELKNIQGPKWRQELSARNGESQQVKDVCKKSALYSNFNFRYVMKHQKYFYPNFTSRYVLKPQREGGGNNVYGDDIRPFLKVDIV